jgi:hypothetical protein
MAAYEVVLKQALELDLDDRAVLIAELTSSIEADSCDPFEDPEFRAEIERRIRSIEDGTAVLIPENEAMHLIFDD